MSKPVPLQIQLHRNGDNSVPDDDRAILAPHSLEVEEYEDPAEDSDVLRRNLAGFAHRTFPRLDRGFAERKIQIRARIHRQAKALNLI